MILLGLIGHLLLQCQGIALQFPSDAVNKPEQEFKTPDAPDLEQESARLSADIESMKESVEEEEEESDEPEELPSAENSSDEPEEATRRQRTDKPQEAPAADATPAEARNSTAAESTGAPAEKAAERLQRPDMPAEECKDAVPGGRCHEAVQFFSQGLEKHPEMFPSVNRSGSEEYKVKQIQEILYSRSAAGCGKPCNLPSGPLDAEAQASPEAAGDAQDAAGAEVQSAADAEDQEEETNETNETRPTLEPMSSKSLTQMSPAEFQAYLGDQDELDKYAYYLTHTSRRKRWEDEMKHEHNNQDAMQ